MRCPGGTLAPEYAHAPIICGAVLCPALVDCTTHARTSTYANCPPKAKMRFMKATEAGTQVLRLTEFHSRTASDSGRGYLCAHTHAGSQAGRVAGRLWYKFAHKGQAAGGLDAGGRRLC